MDVHDELMEWCKRYPMGSQKGVADPMVCAKLFFPRGVCGCYIIEYGPERNQAVGFAVGLGREGLGFLPLHYLLEVRLDDGRMLEVDVFFKQKRASDLGLPV